jgi:hypothetical protein
MKSNRTFTGQKLTLKNILQRDNNWWRFHKLYETRIRPAIVSSVVNLLSCGNTVRGFAEYVCENPSCSHFKRICFSCKNRLCSSCGKKATALWMQKQVRHFPETTYQHVTFTMPCEFWDLFWHNRFLLNLICALAADCVKTVAKKHGITTGIFLALHTFGRDLKRHVHIHLCVTLGGLSNNNTAWKILPKFKNIVLIPLWRTRIIQLLRKCYKKGKLILPKASAHLQKNYKAFNRFLDFHYHRYWNVFCAEPENNHKRNIEYLARYVKRPAIANYRLMHYSGSDVRFWYFDHKTKTKRTFTCSAFDFIAKVIQHIPDKGFRLIRYYGFLANALRGKLLPIVKNLLNLPEKEKVNYTASYAELFLLSFGINPLKCILCGANLRLSNMSFGATQAKLLSFHKQLALMKPCR